MGRRLRLSHVRFCVVFCTMLYAACNLANIDRLSRWFHASSGFATIPFVAYLAAGVCLFMAVFVLLAHPGTIKPFALLLVVLSAAATYFIRKYDVAIDSSMVLNTIHTDRTEVGQLLSPSMLPYVAAILLVATLLYLKVDIVFAPRGRYLLGSGALFGGSLLVAASLLYANFDGIQRAGNVSNKYIVWSLVPVNLLWSSMSLGADAAKPYLVAKKRPIEVSAEVTRAGDLVVVLAVGESSRRANFGVYGYTRRDTTPELGALSGLHLLNGLAARASTIYALPQILTKNDVKLTSLTAKAGVRTACYVNYTLYDNCEPVGETPVVRCGHGGQCYDEDVLPLLEQHLQGRSPGYDLVVLHLGGGSHGPLYRDRHPPEFLRFEPACKDADVASHCTREQLLNSYDNTILYVDHVVSSVARTLERSGQPYVLIYLSDHGESLLENGKLFHGVPPGVSLPAEQAEIPLIVRSSVPLEVDRRPVYRQPEVFDSVLDLFTIRSRNVEADGGFLHRTD